MGYETANKTWTLGPSNAFSDSVNLEALRVRLAAMTEAELIAFGRQMRSLVYPRTYDGDGRVQVSAFSIQLDEARAEWRRRYPRAKASFSEFAARNDFH